MKTCIILGTRPEIVKMSPIIKALEEKHKEYFILHTGQHYSKELDELFFQGFNLPQARYNLGVGSGSHAEETGRMLVGIEEVLVKEKPDIVLVEGDTNTVLAGALAASKLGVKVGHVEAGLRSYDRRMPEEVNRILTDHCSDLLFPPTKNSFDILVGEGINRDRMFISGNTIVDAVQQNLGEIKESDVLDRLGLEKKSYFLVTLHRQENVDSRARFKAILEGLDLIKREFNEPVIYPIHPRSKKMLDLFKLGCKNISLIDPLGFLDFLRLMNDSHLVLTDSGGVQEESCILGVPCVTLRENTERPETIEVGGNVLAGADSGMILDKTRQMLSENGIWDNPFGDGKAGERIVSIITGGLD